MWKDKIKDVIITLGAGALVFFVINARSTGGGALRAGEDGGLLMDSVYSGLPFIRDSLCVIQDSTLSMSLFIRELQDLLDGKDTVVNIVHLGDSHIQAGYLSGRTMRLLQQSFGNAGRGWIAPFKLTRVNEPNDYFITSNITQWIAGKCVQQTPKCPWGIGGIGIQSNASKIDFNLIVTPTNGAGYSFNKVLMYRDLHAMPMVTNHLTDDAVTLSWGLESYEKILVDTIQMSFLIDTLALKGVGMQSGAKTSNANTYYGFMLMNGQPGLLYHSIGVNGARFIDYTNREYLRRLKLINPSLLIVSLGTNESYGRNFNKAEFTGQMAAFIGLVRDELPGVTILMTTPAETYKRVYRNKKLYYERNTNIAKVAEAITSYSVKEGIAYWDLYAITGGDNSCKQWFDAKMFGRDRIHFSQNGYIAQGTLLYKAIIRSCLNEQYALEQPLSAETDTEPEKEVECVE